MAQAADWPGPRHHYVRTPLVEKQISDRARVHGISEEEVITEIMLTEPAIKRLIEPEEVAELVAFLCSGPASFANGSSSVLHGGWSAHGPGSPPVSRHIRFTSPHSEGRFVEANPVMPSVGVIP